jgi:hypothetical protein
MPCPYVIYTVYVRNMLAASESIRKRMAVCGFHFARLDGGLTLWAVCRGILTVSSLPCPSMTIART